MPQAQFYNLVHLLHEHLVHVWVHVRVAHGETTDARAVVLVQKGVPMRK